MYTENLQWVGIEINSKSLIISCSAHTNNQYEYPILTTNTLVIYFLSIFIRQRFHYFFNTIGHFLLILILIENIYLVKILKK
jgi:hypothetical protein